MTDCFEELAKAIESLEPLYWDTPCEEAETIAQQIRHVVGYVRVLHEAVIKNRSNSPAKKFIKHLFGHHIPVNYPNRPKEVFDQTQSAQQAREVSQLVKELCAFDKNIKLKVKETKQSKGDRSSLGRELTHLTQHCAHHTDTIFRIISQERVIQEYVDPEQQDMARKKVKAWAEEQIPWELRAAESTCEC